MDWLTENFWLAWIGIALVLAAIEAATVDFVFVMFAGGALAGAVAAGSAASFPVQVVVAVAVVAHPALFAVRPIDH
jgi:membrane protein implicated in regulation of membrane protease activity